MINKTKLTFAALSLFGSFALAEADLISRDAKLALLVSNPQSLEQVAVSPEMASSVKAEKAVDGDGGSGSSSSYIKLEIKGKSQIYVISKSGDGQILSMSLITNAKVSQDVEKFVFGK